MSGTSKKYIDRNKAIKEMRLVQHASLQEIGQKFGGLTRERIRQIVNMKEKPFTSEFQRDKKKRDKKIEKMYLKENKSIKAISEMIDMTYANIYIILKQRGILKKERKEAL